MRELGRYDTELQMFVEAPKPVNMNRLSFARFLAEKSGRTVSAPVGALALAEAIVAEPIPVRAMRRTIVPGD